MNSISDWITVYYESEDKSSIERPIVFSKLTHCNAIWPKLIYPKLIYPKLIYSNPIYPKLIYPKLIYPKLIYPNLI